jgi:hypothetical protein
MQASPPVSTPSESDRAPRPPAIESHSMVTKPPPRWSTPASRAKSQVPQQTLITRLRCSGWVSIIPAMTSVATFVVAQAEATDALPMPAGKVQLLIVPGSLTNSMHR